MKFLNLVEAVRQAHTAIQQEASKAINRSLTIRNWLIGFYIVEFEQKGVDKARYGINLMDELASKISIKGLSSRNLWLFRLFYLSYPHIGQLLQSQLSSSGINNNQIWQTLSAKLQTIDKQLNEAGSEQLKNFILQQVHLAG